MRQLVYLFLSLAECQIIHTRLLAEKLHRNTKVHSTWWQGHVSTGTESLRIQLRPHWNGTKTILEWNQSYNGMEPRLYWNGIKAILEWNKGYAGVKLR